MSKLISLILEDSKEAVLINPDNINAIVKSDEIDGGSNIFVGLNLMFSVIETPEEVFELIEPRLN